MALAPGRFAYAPIIERPIIKWPGNARIAFWVAPNMEFFEYLPESRPAQPDVRIMRAWTTAIALVSGACLMC